MPKWEQDFHGKSKIGKLVYTIGCSNWCEQRVGAAATTIE